VITVQDTGPGISMEDLPHIFERFYRGSASHETGAPGTGLGLAIVKEVVDRHHGDIQVENVPDGHGAFFTIWLPAKQSRRQTKWIERQKTHGGIQPLLSQIPTMV